MANFFDRFKAKQVSLAPASGALGSAAAEPADASQVASADQARALQQQANGLRARGDLAGAEALYRRILALDPQSGAAFLGLGIVLLDSSRSLLAAEAFAQSHALWPERADPLFFMGLASEASGDGALALAHWRACLAREPDFVPALERAVPALVVQHSDQAEKLVRAALLRSPGAAALHLMLGMLLEQTGRTRDALAAYDTCVAFEPAHIKAHARIAALTNDLAIAPRAKSAAAAFLRAAPDLAQAHFEAARAAMLAAAFGEAIGHADRAAALDATDAHAHFVAGYALLQLQRRREAQDRFRLALGADPEFARAAWAFALCQIPAVFEPGEDADLAWQHFDQELTRLEEWFHGARVADGMDAIGCVQAFFLAYQERDNRALLSRYGALCERLMRDWQVRHGAGLTPFASDGRLQLGIVSHFICNHSVWHALTKGWLAHLDASRIDVHIFALETVVDEETRRAGASAASLTQGAMDLKGWCDAIAARRIEAIIYPDIGMGPMSLKLAAMRLAPVQIASWGHPETTGMASIDYYLSADGLEPAEADQYYSEALIRLPNLGCCYPRLSIHASERDFGALGVRSDGPLLLCPGVPFKYAPQHDAVLVEIARQLGRCQLIFFSHGADNCNALLLQRRLRIAFEAAGLDYDALVLLVPWLSRADFHGLMERADVFLDTLGFSGFNTAMQAIESGLPVVTREGRFMRGRLASGILRRIGLNELVASSDAGYVQIAVRLARDADFRQRMAQNIEARRDILFDDVAPVRALEAFLLARLRAQAPSDTGAGA